MAFTLIAVQTLGAIGLATYLAYTVRGEVRAEVIDELNRQVIVLSSTVQDRNGTPTLPPQTIAAAKEAGIRITLIGTDGTVLADSDSDPALMDNHGNRPEIMAAFNNGEGSSIRYSQTLGADLVYVAHEIDFSSQPGPPSVALRASRRMSVAILTEESIIWAIAFALCANVAVVVITLLALSRSIGVRMQQTAIAARRFANRDLSTRLEEGGPAEFADLAKALNDMAGKLHLSISTLEMQTSEMLSILQSMSNAVIALDGEQCVLRLNSAALEMFDLTEADAIARPVQEVLHESELHDTINKALRTGVRYVDEISLTSGSSRRAQVVAEPLRDAAGKPSGIVLVLEEVTRLRQLEKIRTDFAANVSHELRTPITSIQGYVEMIQDTDDPERRQMCIEVISRNTRRLAAIIEDLLALARLEGTERDSTLEFEMIPLDSIAQAVAQTYKELADRRSATITIAIDSNPMVRGTRQLLEQAIGNLVVNAIVYGGEGNRIEIRTRNTTEGNVRIEIADNGPGIPLEHLDRIFERFYRVDRGRSREVGGTGLGLAIVKHIATVLGGSVEVRSALSHGSVFCIVLPRAIIEKIQPSPTSQGVNTDRLLTQR